MNDTKKKNKELSPREALKKANAVDKRIQKHIREVKQMELQLEKKKETSKLLQQEYSMYIQLAINIPQEIQYSKAVLKDEK